jgi:hypothetical protein
MNNRGGIQSQIVESQVVGLGGNEFETGSIIVAANTTIKKGVVLKRAGANFAPVTDLESEKPVAINSFDIINSGASAANMSFRAIIFGPVRADLLTVNGVVTTPAQNDLIRASTVCIPINVNDISRTE